MYFRTHRVSAQSGLMRILAWPDIAASCG